MATMKMRNISASLISLISVFSGLFWARQAFEPSWEPQATDLGAVATSESGHLTYFDAKGLRVGVSDFGGVNRYFGLSKDGKVALVTGREGTLTWLTLHPEHVDAILKLPESYPDTPHLSPDGETVIVAAGVHKGNGVSSVYVVSVRSHRVLRKLPCSPAALGREAIAFSPDGSLLAVGGYNRVAIFRTHDWALAAQLSGQFKEGFFGGWVNEIAFSRDGRTALVGASAVLRRFDAHRWGTGVRLDKNLYFVAAQSLPGKRRFLVVTQEGMAMVSYENGLRTVGRIPHPTEAGNCLGGSATLDGRLLFSSWDDGRIRVMRL